MGGLTVSRDQLMLGFDLEIGKLAHQVLINP